ncbi:MAG: hypothetical protein EOP14_00015 [Pseudomonas sp.]|nr:MAG: hypothetical protein EOP14_00015 [Pseudomonas sp.]
MKNRPSIGKLTRWLVANGAMAGLVYAGWGMGINGAQNASIFLLVICFICSVCGAMSSTVKASIQKEGMSVPIWANLGYDLVLACFLAWHGSWVWAIVVGITMFATASFYGEDE